MDPMEELLAQAAQQPQMAPPPDNTSPRPSPMTWQVENVSPPAPAGTIVLALTGHNGQWVCFLSSQDAANLAAALAKAVSDAPKPSGLVVAPAGAVPGMRARG